MPPLVQGGLLPACPLTACLGKAKFTQCWLLTARDSKGVWTRKAASVTGGKASPYDMGMPPQETVVPTASVHERGPAAGL